MLLAEVAGTVMKLPTSSTCPALAVQTNPAASRATERSSGIECSCGKSCKALRHRCHFSSGHLSAASVIWLQLFLKPSKSQLVTFKAEGKNSCGKT